MPSPENAHWHPPEQLGEACGDALMAFSFLVVARMGHVQLSRKSFRPGTGHVQLCQPCYRPKDSDPGRASAPLRSRLRQRATATLGATSASEWSFAFPGVSIFIFADEAYFMMRLIQNQPRASVAHPAPVPWRIFVARCDWKGPCANSVAVAASRESSSPMDGAPPQMRR